MARPEKKKKNLIRILGTDIDANLSVLYGLAKIKGVSVMFSNAICVTLNFNKNSKISELTEKETEKLENFLNNPKKDKIPTWLLNQRKDLETGEDLHLASKDIEFDLLQLKRRIGKLKTYKGLRLRNGLTVRGQRTRSNFRKNKTMAAMKSKKGGRK